MTIKLINKSDGEVYTIYDIIYDKAGYPHFLIYKDGEWVRMSAKHFRPYNEEDLRKMFKDYCETGVLTMSVP